MTEQQLAALRELGSEWQKNGMHRIYFNGLGELYGVETVRYNSGNIASATLDGESISNSKAFKILTRLAEAKVWYDYADNKFHGRGIETDDFHVITRAIMTKVKQEVAA